MNTLSRLFLTGLTAVAFGPMAAQNSVVINEVMQSNIDYLFVEGDYPDSWVELYNPTNRAVDISNYRLGEKSDAGRAYTLPRGISIPAHGHFLIYCDKEATGVHTDFRVDAGKATVYLFDKNGVELDRVSLTEMPAANVAYGRVTDGADEWQYEFTPTAGTANTGDGSDVVLPDPIFSMDGGIMEHPAYMTITMPEGVPADAKIYLTIDGKEPTLASSSGPQATIPIQKSMVVRAKIMSPSHAAISGRSVTRSFIFHPRAVTLPVISIVSDDAYFYGAANGILTSNVNNGIPNYMRKWRRPINVEYFDKEGKTVFNQLGETAVSGVSTREQPQKSMKIYTNKRFGKKNFKGGFWEDKPNVNKVKSFVIRSGGNNSAGARVNDALVQKLFGTHTDNLDWQAYQPVIVYLNGEYLGEFGMRERSDENYVESNYDGLEDVEVADENEYQSPTMGSLFSDFYNSYTTPGVQYEQLAPQIDMDNFVESLIAEIYAQNTDYPTNNVSLWRPTEEGGKWRWILKDMDRYGMQLSLYPRDFNMLRYMFTPDDIQFAGMHHFDLYANMVTYPEFRNAFLDKFAVYLGDFLRPDVVLALLDKMEAEIGGEVQATFRLYNMKYQGFTDGMKYLRSIIEGRTATEARTVLLYSMLNDYFQLGGVLPMQVNTEACAATINGVKLTEGNFNGSFFASHPLRLAAAKKNYGWTMTITHTDGTTDEKSFAESEVALTLGDYMSGASDLFSVAFTPVKVSDDEPEEPVVDPEEPVVDPDEPVVDPDEPVVDPDEPVVDPDEPVVDPDEPEQPSEPEDVSEPDIPLIAWSK